jgi:light-regulated signal transduction histidine kinase (bacteriophytochrome)
MGYLIDGLLQLSRLNRAEIEKEAVSLTTLVKEALNTMMRYDPDRNVELKIQEGLIAQADLVLMQAVLQNLLSNAWKFTQHKNPAVIEFGSDVILGKETFFIRDNGVGFDMKYADKLFGAFQRLHSVSEFPGNGIGLATVQRIIGRHGGAIWADSVPDEGTTFYFALQEG